MNEDVSPIKHGDFPASHVNSQGGYLSPKKRVRQSHDGFSWDERYIPTWQFCERDLFGMVQT